MLRRFLGASAAAARRCFATDAGAAANARFGCTIKHTDDENSFSYHGQEDTRDIIRVDKDIDSKVAVVTLNRPPVNSVSGEMLFSLVNAIDKLENCPNTEAMVITSSTPKIFTAGLDINELYQPESSARFREFWTALQVMFLRLYGTSLSTCSAINGACPGGGCLISICTDYRIMAHGNHTIGLNESQFGMVVPPYFAKTFEGIVGTRMAELLMTKGELLSPEQAHSVGLVDAVLPAEEILSAARGELVDTIKADSAARHQSKMTFRGPIINALVHNREQDLEFFTDLVLSNDLQSKLGSYLESLRAKSKNK